MSDDETKPAEKKPCETCGQVHEDSPFTGEMFEMYEQFRNPETSAERKVEIVLELARIMVERESATDIDLPEGWHALLQEVTDAHAAWQVVTLRAGRTVLRELARAAANKDNYEHLREALKMGRVMVFSPDGPPTPEDPKGAKKPLN